MALNDNISFLKQTLGQTFSSIYFVDMISRKVDFIKVPERFASYVNSSMNLPQLIDFFVNQMIPEERDVAREFLDISTIEKRLRGRKPLSHYFASVDGPHGVVEIVPVAYGARGELLSLMFAARLLHEGKKLSDNERERLLQQLHIVHALSSDYSNVFLVYPSIRMIKVIRLDGYVTQGLSSTSERLFPYEETVRRYVNDRVYPDDVPNLLAFFDLDYLMSLSRTHENYEYDYRVLEDGEIHYYQGRLKTVPDSESFILAFRNIDHKVLRDQLFERTREEARQSNILSQITKQLYGYNLTIDLDTLQYSMIEGTGMPKTRAIFSSHSNYKDATSVLAHYINPDYLTQLSEVASVDRMRERQYVPGFVGSLEFPVRYPDTDKDEWHEVNVFINVDEHGIPMANVLGRDITEAHEKEVTRQQLELANAANEAKTSFLFNMSHEIRTPMNAIVGFTELLQRHQDDPVRRQDYLDKMRDSSTSLLSLINNVLEMARIEKGTINLEHLPWSIEQFTDSLFSVFAEMMKQKGITFTHEVHVSHYFIYCDPIKLREVFLNILSNAYKYTNPGGSVHMCLQEVGADQHGRVLYRSTISDTGIGMSPDFLPHLFEGFTRERTTTESQVEGTGLGMQIVKRLVDLMEGTIEVESTVGVGSTFTVTIPHFTANRTDLSTYSENSSAQPSPEVFRGRRLLLAEDNELNAEIAMEILTEAGFLVERAVDGQDCIERLVSSEPHHFDAILMDIQMPRLNGYEATRQIRQNPDPQLSQIPIIAMTANAFQEDRIEAFKAGMNGHLSKPIDISILMETLHEILLKSN